ncbi:unnamed protein product [Sphagnum jensenii]|jgi:hypothetical protein|uniref:GOLD domain-containing protein n=1 Tax=Sphagnum jensenii TaxID=128206 RepID=A0ABP0VQC5_9BRYO
MAPAALEIGDDGGSSSTGGRRMWNLLLAVATVLSVFLRSTEGLTISVHKVECVYEEVEYDGDMVYGNFVVQDRGVFWGPDHPGIELVVTGPQGNRVHASTTKDSEKFEFRANRRGLYTFCFHSRSLAPEQLTFYIHVGHIPGIQDLAQDEHLKPVNVKIAQLAEALESVSAEIRYMQTRDKRHRSTNESTQRRLVAYTVAEYIMLLAVSIGQVYLIQQLFSKRLGYNRV